jgi:hypothetical protein
MKRSSTAHWEIALTTARDALELSRNGEEVATNFKVHKSKKRARDETSVGGGSVEGTEIEEDIDSFDQADRLTEQALRKLAIRFAVLVIRRCLY